MLGRLRTLLARHLGNPDGTGTGTEDYRLAVATLMVEVAHGDGCLVDAERRTLTAALQRSFGLDDVATAELVAAAETEAGASTSDYPFTRLINEHCSPEQKSRLVRDLWTIAHADGHIDAYEEYLIRKIAGLIHVPHAEFIATRLATENGIDAQKSSS